MKINIKPFKQSKGYCGPACLKMIMDYYKIKHSEGYWAKLTKSSRIHGCDEQEIVNVANKLGFNSYLKENSSILGVKRLIEEGIPVIVDWFSPEEGGHYSVVTGFKGKNIFLADPHFGKIKKHNVDWFEERWFDCVFRKEGPIIKEIIVIKR